MFERQLTANISTKLALVGIFDIQRRQGNILAFSKGLLSEDQKTSCVKFLQNIFGIASFSFGIQCEKNLVTIKEKAVLLLRATTTTTFKVVTRRSDKTFIPDSQEVSRDVGEHILGMMPERKVDVHNPETKVFIEISQREAIVSVERFSGQGGLPSGTSGKVIALLSGGIDSPVAAWKVMRRGCSVSFVHFHSFPYTNAASIAKARRLAAVLEQFQKGTTFYAVPLGDAQREIMTKSDPALRVLLYRRMMMKIAERIAVREHALALVTGDSIGQVASQTLENIQAVSQVHFYIGMKISRAECRICSIINSCSKARWNIHSPT